jgi:hypothetical protein
LFERRIVKCPVRGAQIISAFGRFLAWGDLPFILVLPGDVNKSGANIPFPPDLAVARSQRQRPLRGMKTISRDQGRAAVIRFKSGRSAAGESGI